MENPIPEDLQLGQPKMYLQCIQSATKQVQGSSAKIANITTTFYSMHCLH